MNYFKYIACWWNKTHVFCNLRLKDGKLVRSCIRCGYKQDY